MGEQCGSAAEHRQLWLPATVTLLEPGLAKGWLPLGSCCGPKGMPAAGQVLLQQPGCCSHPKAAARCDACSPQHPGWQGLVHRSPNTTIRAEPSLCQRQSLGIHARAAFLAAKWPFSSMPLFLFYNAAQRPENGSAEPLWHQGG